MSDGEDKEEVSSTASAFWLKTDLLGRAIDMLAHEQGEPPIDEAVFYLDASVLLRPYEVGSGLADLERIYTLLADQKRLVVPGQAVREFYLRRTNMLLDVTAMLKGLGNVNQTNKLSERSATLEADPDFADAARMYREAGDAYRSAMNAVAEKLKPVIQRHEETPIGADALSKMYARVLPPTILDPDWSNDDRGMMEIEWAQRYASSHPPGFKDDGRNGDYLFWKTILISAASHKRPGIIVTGEKKPDWFARGKADVKTRRLRPELVAEYIRASDGKPIYSFELKTFVEALKASTKTIDAVKTADRAREIERSRLIEAMNVARMRLIGANNRQREITKRRNELQAAKYSAALSAKIENAHNLILSGHTSDVFPISEDKLLKAYNALTGHDPSDALLDRTLLDSISRSVISGDDYVLDSNVPLSEFIIGSSGTVLGDDPIASNTSLETIPSSSKGEPDDSQHELSEAEAEFERAQRELFDFDKPDDS